MVPMNVYVSDDSVQQIPIAGVRVGAYHPTTYALMATATTDENGRATFALDGGVYELRFYKSEVLFDNPKVFTVVEPEDPDMPNGCQISGTVLAFGAPLDSDLCRCVGRFVDFSNQSMDGIFVKILTDPESGAESPKVLNGQMVGSVSRSYRTDKNGRVIIDLIRGGEFRLIFAGEEDRAWPFKVPDRTTANLIDLIHPQPVSVSYEPAALMVGVGQTTTTVATLLMSDFQEVLMDLGRFIEFANANPDIADVNLSSNGVISVTGRKAGIAKVTVSVVRDLLPKRIPAYEVFAPDLLISVS